MNCLLVICANMPLLSCRIFMLYNLTQRAVQAISTLMHIRTMVHELERYVRPAFSALQGHPFKRNHLVAVCPHRLPSPRPDPATPSAIAGVVRRPSWTRQRL